MSTPVDYSIVSHVLIVLYKQALKIKYVSNLW